MIIDQIGIFKAENIVDNKDQLIELIRQISEFIMYGQKYQREDYFESFMEKGTMNKLVFIHQQYVFEINQQILQTVNILVLNIQDRTKLSKSFMNSIILLTNIYFQTAFLRRR